MAPVAVFFPINEMQHDWLFVGERDVFAIAQLIVHVLANTFTLIFTARIQFQSLHSGISPTTYIKRPLCETKFNLLAPMNYVPLRIHSAKKIGYLLA